MEFNHKINIDFLESCKTGKFDYLEIGQSQEYILANFPKPFDGESFNRVSKGIDIWLYGNIELHFFDGILTKIYSDHFYDNPLLKLDGGKYLEIFSWIFTHDNEITLTFFIRELLAEQIDFSIRTTPSFLEIKLASGVVFTFTNESFDNMSNEKNLNPDSLFVSSFAFC